MRTVNPAKLPQVIVPIVLAYLLLAGCVATDRNLAARLSAANLLAASIAQGLASATQVEAIRPDSETAHVIMCTLDAVESSLDGAGAALRAGLPEIAAHNLDAAETQIAVLQPLLPPVAGER